MVDGSLPGSLADRLGIPANARRVLVFAESTHWDPNWMLRAGEYFRFNVHHVLDRVLDELALEPQRVFDLECTLFVQRYVERTSRGEELLQRAKEGRLRFTSSGVTTADTQIPGAEALLRDLLLGQEWMRSVGIDAEPKVAYFPDSFGHSPALSSILRAAGFEFACVSRIDGMWFPGAEWRMPSSFPLACSSAEMLLGAKTLDFVWRAPDGSGVLAHWNAFGYGHGDMIASHGLMRFMHLPVVLPDRSDGHVRRRIERYARQLAALSRTRYSLVVMGLDFVPPVHRLVGLLDRFNELHYEDTGIFALNASLEDYFELVSAHRSALPVVDLDPNPYWTGFYSSRPTLKRKAKELLQTALAAEAASVLTGAWKEQGESPSPAYPPELGEIWQTVAVANHHDFITGTSPERVYLNEQLCWVEESLTKARGALVGCGSQILTSRPRTQRSRPSLEETAAGVEVATERYRLVFDATAGGRLVEWAVLAEGAYELGLEDGSALLSAPLGLACYVENGGLWRMGMELQGGRFEEIDIRARPAQLRVEELPGAVVVSMGTSVAGQPALMRFWIGDQDPLLRIQVCSRVAPRRCVVLRVPSPYEARGISTAVPGGVVARPLSKLYSPTFWPLHTAAWSVGAEGGLCVAAASPTAVSLRSPGTFEVISGRNAPKELGFGFLPQPALPARGYERSAARLDLALWPLAPGESFPGHSPEGLGALLASAAGVLFPEEDWLAPIRRALVSAFEPDDPDVAVIAAKPASRGEGVVVRLMAPQALEARVVQLVSRKIAVGAAYLCDSRERDLKPLSVRRRRSIEVPMEQSTASVRVVG